MPGRRGELGTRLAEVGERADQEEERLARAMREREGRRTGVTTHGWLASVGCGRCSRALRASSLCSIGCSPLGGQSGTNSN